MFKTASIVPVLSRGRHEPLAV